MVWAAALTVAVLLTATTDALTVKATYQGRYGSNGTVTLRHYTNGTGSVIVNLTTLPAGRTYTFRLATGTCTSSTATGIPARTLKVTSAGKLAGTWSLTSSQVSSIASKLAAGKVVAVLTAGSSRLCRALVVVKPTPTPTPTPAPSGGVVANISTHKFGYGPTLTPASMSNWFPALKAGVTSSATATVTAGQNVYALFVVPAGGSVTFKVSSSSAAGGWYWQWNSTNSYWTTPELYFYNGQFVTLNAGTTWAFGLAFNDYAGSETLTIATTAITKP